MGGSTPLDAAHPATPSGFPTGLEIATTTLAAAPFADLDEELPLLLLPVRIETRYRKDADPPELRIRIYPDQLHIDTRPPGPGAVEAELTRQFWRERLRAGEGPEHDRARRAAWRTFVRRVGPNRAGDLARRLRPLSVSPAGPVFPKPDAPDAHEPARPVLLPRQWVAVGYSADGVLFSRPGRTVPRDLRTAPDPHAPPWQVPGAGVVTDEALAWMFDYERAVDVGMAITVPLVGDAAPALELVSTLLVVGVDAELGPVDTAAELDRLLGVHARASGLAFVPAGTPTNNTESVASGWSAQPTETGVATGFPEPPIDLPDLPDLPGLPDPPGLPDLPPRPSPGRAGGREANGGVDPTGEVEPTGGLETTGGNEDGGGSDNAARLAAALGLAEDTTLRLAPFGTDNERSRSRAMVRVTYEAVLGTFARRLLRVRGIDAMPQSALDGLRTWCIQHVTGGAPYSTLRIGPQPYGILPVRRSTVTDTPETTAEHLQAVVSLLVDEWRRSAAALPVLDPDRADVAGAEAAEHDASIAGILATQPHPQRLFVRRLEDFAALDAAGQAVLTPQNWYTGIVLAGLTPSMNPNLVPPYSDLAVLVLMATFADPPQTIDDQIALWNSVDDDIYEHMLFTHAGDDKIFEYIIDAHAYVDVVLGLLGSYEQRQRPVRWLDLDRFEGALGEANTSLIEGVLQTTSVEWGAEGLIQAREAVPAETAAGYLADLKERFADRDSDGELASTTARPDPEPLLHQLLDRTLHLVPTVAAEEAQVESALDELADLVPDELEWLLRETLGLGTHRLDAWATSLATERLARLRADRPKGLQVGGFGWVTQLDPRASDRLSEGFVHAPSMAHATTAAMLRSGWQAHGNDDPLSAAAVDLSSARVRAASWLLDGIRAGEDLGGLLGYRFERTLHDLAADEEIRRMRTAVLVASGRPDVAPDEPVDGVALLDLYRSGALGEVVGLALTAIQDLESSFDAVNDVGLFEAVHQLAGASFERATAILDTMATGTRTPPELRATRTPRAGTSVEHRVLILLDPAATPPAGRGWTGGIRDAVAPALEAWTASLLPPADQVGFIVHPWAGGTPAHSTLADLRLSALDAIWLVGDDPNSPPASLQVLAAGDIVPGDDDHGGIPLREFAVLAIELRRSLDSLRVADARDLRPAALLGSADADDSAAVAAVDALVARFAATVNELDLALTDGAFGRIAAAATWLARAGVTARGPLLPGDLAAAGDLHAAAARRLEAARHAGETTREAGGGRRSQPERRLAALIGGRVPLLASFDLAPAEGGDVVDLSPGVAGPAAVGDWLDAVGLVRPGISRLTTAGMLSELLAPDGGLRACAGQWPLLPGESWAATAAPPPRTSGRLSVVAITGPSGPPVAGARVCGLVVDAWAEWIPRDEQVTGVAVHFDAPGNRPPQSMLLAVTPDGEPWSLDLVLDTLLETLEWATLRAVAPEDLLDYGRAVPTVFVPGDLRPWPQETTS